MTETLADKISVLRDSWNSLKEVYKTSYGKDNATPYENEGVVHLVVPLLEALGWPPERMGFETHFSNLPSGSGTARLDISLYSCNSRKQEHLAAIIEAKQTWGVEGDEKRLRTIAEEWRQWFKTYHSDNKDIPERFILTTGLLYHIYLKKSNGLFPQKPNACFNLLSDEILDANKELTEALEIMSPRG